MTLPRWDETSPYLVPALARGGNTHGLEDVREMCESGVATFWPGVKSAVVTQVVDYPTGPVCKFWLAGGDLDELRVMEALISGLLARDHGVRKFTIEGRNGWSRVLQGYKPLSTIAIKEI
jgi:hypothetical protein